MKNMAAIAPTKIKNNLIIIGVFHTRSEINKNIKEKNSDARLKAKPIIDSLLKRELLYLHICLFSDAGI